MRFLAFAVMSALFTFDVAARADSVRPSEQFETTDPELTARLACTLQPVGVLGGERHAFDVRVNEVPCAEPIRDALAMRISIVKNSVLIDADVPPGISSVEVQRVVRDVRFELEGRLGASAAPQTRRSPGLIVGGIGVLVLGLGTSFAGGFGLVWGSSSHSCSDRGCASPPLEFAGVGVAGLVVGAAAVVGGIYMIVVGAKSR